MTLAPILLFAYNRPDHLAQTLSALRANLLAAESTLYIYSDAPATEKDAAGVAAVRALIQNVEGFQHVEVIERDTNWGLATNIIAGVTERVNAWGRVIVLEDDLLTSPYFLTFMNEGLSLYATIEQVMCVQAHVLATPEQLPETFFIRFANSWGWATWQRAWQQFEPDGRVLLRGLEQRQATRRFDFDGRYPFTRMLRRQIAGQNHSWAIRWNASLFLADGLSLNAGRSLVRNIGTDGSGTNFKRAAEFRTNLYAGDAPLRLTPEAPLVESELARRAIGRIFAYEYSKITKAKHLVFQLWRRFSALFS